MELAGNKIGVSKAFVGQVMSGKKEPGQKIADYFGLDRHIVYTLRDRGRAIAPIQDLNQEMRSMYGDSQNDEGDGGVEEATPPDVGDSGSSAPPVPDTDNGESDLD